MKGMCLYLLLWRDVFKEKEFFFRHSNEILYFDIKTNNITLDGSLLVDIACGTWKGKFGSCFLGAGCFILPDLRDDILIRRRKKWCAWKRFIQNFLRGGFYDFNWIPGLFIHFIRKPRAPSAWHILSHIVANFTSLAFSKIEWTRKTTILI